MADLFRKSKSHAGPEYWHGTEKDRLFTPRNSAPKPHGVRLDTPEDIYAVLGVGRRATAAEIREAYRMRAKELHPDRNPDPEAEELFKAISQAVGVLSDPAKRRLVDRGHIDGVGKLTAAGRQHAREHARSRWFGVGPLVACGMFIATALSTSAAILVSTLVSSQPTQARGEPIALKQKLAGQPSPIVKLQAAPVPATRVNKFDYGWRSAGDAPEKVKSPEKTFAGRPATAIAGEAKGPKAVALVTSLVPEAAPPVPPLPTKFTREPSDAGEKGSANVRVAAAAPRASKSSAVAAAATR